MVSQTGFRRWLAALVVCSVAVVVCVEYVDRPAAEFFERTVHHSELHLWLTHFLRPFVLVPVAALGLLFGAGCWRISGRELAAWTEIPLLCCWSIVWALAVEFAGKEICGRSWPVPTYLSGHQYGFRWLHGGPGWTSFPSGTALGAWAPAAVLWQAVPRFRVAGALLATLLCAGAVATNGHWVSDVIAGAFVGVSIGWMTVAMRRAR